jgi:hypothetical protein
LWRRFQRSVGLRLRAVIDDSVAAGLAVTDAGIAELHARLDGLEHAVTAANLPVHAAMIRDLQVWAHRHALEVEAQTHRVEECLAFLEVQHDAVREVLDHLGPKPTAGAGE